MSKSDFLENKILDHIFGGGDYARPATLYVALFTSAPSDAGGGTEVTGGAYARAAVTNDSTNWPAAAGGVKGNGTSVTFAQATAPWGNVGWFAVFDALTGGNMLYWGALTTSRSVATGDTPSYAVGQIQFTED
jgi:hypothetical protein